MTRNKREGIADPRMSEKIDQLSASHIGDLINLPQLVVVGNQSSGKSSVLEGLTGLPFPKDSGLCTRFATQITFRRARKAATIVRVIPALDATEIHRQRCALWQTTTAGELDASTFARVIYEAMEVMCIAGDFKPQQTFSKDILSIEVTGKKEEHFSVIDVPGIFKKTTEGITTKADMEIVRTMVEGYMANERCIILAVVPANVDIATQEILDMAEKYDPTGARTLGVLTKPDLVDKGAESKVLELLNGTSHKLFLGWCILRNLGQKESESREDRYQLEDDFFENTSPWNQVDKSKVGVQALRARLQGLLRNLIRQEFPRVKADLDKELKKQKERMEALGPERTTTNEQYSFLIKIATRFKDMTSKALGANYSDDAFDQKKYLKLANKITERNEVFMQDFQDRGHSYEFGTSAKMLRDMQEEAEEPFTPRDTHTRIYGHHDDLLELIAAEEPLPYPSQSGVVGFLSKLYKDSRGFEMGTYDPRLLSKAMKGQSTKWDMICHGFISDIIFLVHRYILELLALLSPNRTVYDGLCDVMRDRMMTGYYHACEKVNFLLHVELRQMPMTQNAHFHEGLQESRERRVTEALDEHTITLNDGRKVVERSFAYASNSLSSREHIVQEMHDVLHSYYSVARRRIVDNVIGHAVNYHLLEGSTSPLKSLTPDIITALNAEQLDRIAGEDEITKKSREQLKRQIEGLEKGKKILQAP